MRPAVQDTERGGHKELANADPPSCRQLVSTSHLAVFRRIKSPHSQSAFIFVLLLSIPIQLVGFNCLLGTVQIPNNKKSKLNFSRQGQNKSGVAKGLNKQQTRGSGP